MTSEDKLLKEARQDIEDNKKIDGAKKLIKAADQMAKRKEYHDAAKVLEEVALVFRDLYQAESCLKALDQATVMLIRITQTPEVYAEIVRVNKKAAKIAEEATEYRKAADYYFRAKDFAMDSNEKKELSIKAADALENAADIEEEHENYAEAVGLLRKVGTLYYTAGDDELGGRINDRAVKIAQKWAKVSRKKGDYLSAGNALAEAAQIMQTLGNSPEATRAMMEAGELYEAAHLYEKAGNIYDAAQEAYKLQRLTSARNQALSKAGEAYLKMEGKPEAVAPLLIKGGYMFKEIGSAMKAKWAFKRAAEMFEDLAQKAQMENDIESEKKYLRYQALCLKNWGYDEQSEQIYRQVTEYYLKQATTSGDSGNKEQQAVALEEAAEVFAEFGKHDDSKKQLEQAIELYVQVADESATNGDFETSSKLYSKAADCAKKLGDIERNESFHSKASEKAEKAAEFYAESGVLELATIWKRTAGIEALQTNSEKMIEKAIDLLTKSAEGFRRANELKEAFEDLYAVFEARFLQYPDKKGPIKDTIKMMEEISIACQDDVMTALLSLIRAMNDGNHIGALLILQENEEGLLAKADRIRLLIDHSKKVRTTK